MAIGPSSLMQTAYKKVGAVLWVPPDEIASYLRYKNFSRPIALELSDWIARMFSMAFVAGQRGVKRPVVTEASVLTTLSKMGYSTLRAQEITSIIIENLPGLYAKGQTRTALQ